MPQRSRLLPRALIGAVIAIHILAVIAPADVLFPVDPGETGRRILAGELPYRDFAFEYPPGAVLAFVLPGLAPRALAPQALALQAIALELAVVWWVLRRIPGAVARWLPLSLLLFPFMAGGFDAFPMAAIAFSTALLVRGDRRGWWAAALGTLVKLSPGVAWVWCRRALPTSALALALTVPLLLAPAALVDNPDDTYIGYSLHRGVQVESVAASSAWLTQLATGDEPEFTYRFRSFQISGAGWAEATWAAVAALGLVLVALRARSANPWLAAFAAVALFLAGAKVLSPQFVAWPAPLAAVLGGRWFQAWLAVTGLTVLAYVGEGPTWIMSIATARNAVLVVTAGGAVRSLMLRESRP